MSLQVILRDEAEADIAQAAIWHERQSSGLGAKFVAAVDECFALCSQHPEAFPVVYRGARLGILRKFPYLVVYGVFPEFISVVAVMNGRRHPRRWKARLTE